MTKSLLSFLSKIRKIASNNRSECRRVKQTSLREIRAIIWDEHREVAGVLRWRRGKIEIVAKGTAVNVTMDGVVLEDGDWPFHTHLLSPYPSSIDWESTRYVIPQLIIGPPNTGGFILLRDISIHIDDNTRLPCSIDSLLQKASRHPERVHYSNPFPNFTSKEEP